MDTPAGARGRGALIVLTATAAPVALGFEALLRHLLFPPDFELVRQSLRPALTPVAWLLAALAVAAGIAGVALQRRIAARAVARLPPERRSAAQVDQARVGAFLLAASVPQVPAVLATVAFMLGASIAPVLVAIGVVTAAVGLQALRTRVA